MFNKNKFAHIIKNIKETYSSQEEFAKTSEIGRTYLSLYMNMKLDEPPKPKILEKLAKASNGITTYEELMQICGYYRDSNLSNESNIVKRILEENSSILKKYHLTNEQYEELQKILLKRNEEQESIERQLNSFVNCSSFEGFDNELTVADLYNDIIKINENISYVLKSYQYTDLEYPIPLYKNIIIDKKGYLDKSNCHAIKYINLNITLEKISNLKFYFGLIISDNSMFPLLDVGDVAIIYETIQFTNGGTYLLQINNNLPIIRKIVETTSGLELHAMNMWNYPVIKNIKRTDINIIGKVIQAENESAFKN